MCEKDGANKPAHDEGDDDIASQQKYMILVQSHIGQEDGEIKMVASPAIQIICASRSHNTSNTSSREVCKKDGVKKPLHDEGGDNIASNQK